MKDAVDGHGRDVDVARRSEAQPRAEKPHWNRKVLLEYQARGGRAATARDRNKVSRGGIRYCNEKKEKREKRAKKEKRARRERGRE